MKRKKKFRYFYGKRRKRLMDVPNERGNLVRSWHHDSERYYYDFNVCTPTNGWKQWDTSQDASYFGVWVHPIRREILTYCEGDVSLVKCTDDVSFRLELQSMADFYGDPPPAFKCFGEKDGKWERTDIYDERFMGNEDAVHT